MSDIILGPNASPNASDPAQADTPALDMGPEAAPPPTLTPMMAGDMIMDVDTPAFVAEVIEASAQIPVIVYFSAPWCEPCKTLGPLMEKMVKRAGGLVKMAKVNVDNNKELAGQLRVQSVPTVFAFKDGRPLDAFAGAVPESKIKSFIEKLIGDAKPPMDAALEAAQEALKAGDGIQAEDIYMQVLSQDPTIVPAFAGIIRAIALQGDFDRAREMLGGLDAKTLATSDVQQAISALELAEQGAGTDQGEIAELQAKVDKKPKDLQARLELAQAQFAAQHVEAAIDNLLDIVAQDRGWNDEAGRKQLIKIFDTLGPTDPVTVEARKRLSAVLFS